MVTTEVARLSLVPGSDIGDPNSAAAQVLKDCGGTIQQTDGVQQLQFGMEIENPSSLQMMINWDSKKHHEDFMASDAYQPFLQRFKSIMAGPPHLVHVDFSPDGGVSRALSAPVTEVATFYWSNGPPENALQSAREFLELCEKEEPDSGITGWAYGTTHEEIEKEGVKGKGAVLLIGWPDVETHMEFRKKEVFQKNRPMLAQGCEQIEVHHVAFLNYVA